MIVGFEEEEEESIDHNREEEIDEVEGFEASVTRSIIVDKMA